MAEFFHGRLTRFIAAALAIYAGCALLTEAPLLILILNDLVLSAALGVCIAYAPVLPMALASRHPMRGDFLGVGIFFVAACMLVLRVVSIVARDLRHPDVYNGHWVTFSLLLGLIGALLHLWAPQVRDGRVPRERWPLTGIVVAVGLFLGLGSWSMHQVLTHPSAIELR